MNVIVVIPARYGSTRLPAKPLAQIAGQSLIQRVTAQAQNAGNVDGVYVATDDIRILEHVENFGGHAIMTDPDLQSGTDRVAEVAHELGLADDDVLINIQGDQPLIHSQSISDLIAVFLAPNYNPAQFEMATLVHHIHDEKLIHNPNCVKAVLDVQSFALYFSRAPIAFGRDDWSHTVYKHLGVYAYTKRFLDKIHYMPFGMLENAEKLEQLRVLENGYRIKCVSTEHDSPEVDVPEDITRVERILKGA